MSTRFSKTLFVATTFEVPCSAFDLGPSLQDFVLAGTVYDPGKETSGWQASLGLQLPTQLGHERVRRQHPMFTFASAHKISTPERSPHQPVSSLLLLPRPPHSFLLLWTLFYKWHSLFSPQEYFVGPYTSWHSYDWGWRPVLRAWASAHREQTHGWSAKRWSGGGGLSYLAGRAG